MKGPMARFPCSEVSVAMAGLWTLSLPLYADLAIAAIVLGLGWRLPAKEFLLVAVSLNRALLARRIREDPDRNRLDGDVLSRA
jgi:hypothetical protein